MYDGPWALVGIESFDLQQVLTDSSENGFGGKAVYSGAADFFFQVVFVATAMSIVSGAVAERMKLWAFLLFAVLMAGLIYPLEGAWTWGGQAVFGLYSLRELGFSDFAGAGIGCVCGEQRQKSRCRCVVFNGVFDCIRIREAAGDSHCQDPVCAGAGIPGGRRRRARNRVCQVSA